MKRLFKNAKIFDGAKEYVADILVNDGKIEKISESIECKCDVTDLKGKIVIPGAVDVHTHFSLDLGTFVAIDDFYTGTVAAAMGGTTSVVDHMGFGPKGCELTHQIGVYHGLADDKAVIDFAFHGVIDHMNDERAAELCNMTENGVPSFKIYLTYGGRIDDEAVMKVLVAAKKCGAVITVHAENHGSIEYLRDKAQREGKLENPLYHALTRPNESEAEAVNRMIYLAEMAGNPKLYFVHVSTKESLEEIRNARARGLNNIYCETCTQYLTMTDDLLDNGAEGLKYICSPPLRKRADVEALWRAVEDGTVDVIATDHCPFYFRRDKLLGVGDFRKAPGGIPGVEERVEIVLSEGLRRGISFNKLVDVLCVAPAKIFGLIAKGVLSEGYDADFCVLEEKKYTIEQANRHSVCDYTCYEGIQVDMRVAMTVSRGEIIVENKKLKAERGRGLWLWRKV